jgi:hypothetical protein
MFGCGEGREIDLRGVHRATMETEREREREKPRSYASVRDDGGRRCPGNALWQFSRREHFRFQIMSTNIFTKFVLFYGLFFGRGPVLDIFS